MTDGLGLGDAYGATLDRIKGQGGRKARLGMATLMWISHAEQPLKPDDLRYVLAVEIGSLDLNSDNVPSIGTLLACCQGLVVVDKEVSAIRLIHFTLQEYLRAHPELFGAAHSTIAETCLSYLDSQQIRALSTDDYPDSRITPFLEYSSLYWGVHAKRDLSACAKRLALKLFEDSSNHISADILFESEQGFGFNDLDEPPLFSGLHWASIFGIDEIVAGLVAEEGCDINGEDSAGNTPLMWAAHSGHEGVVKILLGRSDVNPNKTGSDWTPLSIAACNGNGGVVKMLLGREDVNPDEPGPDGLTPLCWAFDSKHNEIVKMLLRREGVDPNKLYDLIHFGEGPLEWAFENGNEELVKAILGRGDLNPDELDMYGQTPLCWASGDGHEGIVKMLLGREDVNPDKSDEDGRTPLCCAAWNGHEGVVKILLARDDVNPDKPDKDCQTPLWCAAWNGHEGVVNILLARDDVNPNELDKYG